MASDLTINPKTIYSELQKFKVQMEDALPRHMTPDRMARIALTQLRINKKLFDCTAQSFYGSLMAASQLGLEPGVNGQCYLIPYGAVCTLVPGWRGYMDLVGGRNAQQRGQMPFTMGMNLITKKGTNLLFTTNRASGRARTLL